ncbi:MAG: hypothetical protein IJY69_02260 [Clostridia bacterium]|nr:hypothetical protein [Clostridia bacterium]
MKVSGEKKDVRYSLVENSENQSIKTQLRAHIAQVNEMAPVANINYDVIDKISSRKDAKELYRQIGFKVERQNFGIILLGDNEIGESSNYLFTKAEYAAWMAVPKVLKRGIIISGHTDHKNEGFSTITIAAPVIINDVRGNMVVVVKKRGNIDTKHTGF